MLDPKRYKNKRILGYCRFSSEKQNSATIKVQKDVITLYAKDNGIVVSAFFCDEAKTGRNTNREGYNLLMIEIKKGDVGAVICYNIDRLNRDLGNAIDLFSVAKSHKVDIIEACSSSVYVYDDPTSILNYQNKAALAEYYSSSLSQRVKVAKGLSAARGEESGGKAPYGYSIDKETRKLKIEKSQARGVQKLFELYNKGYDYDAIAKELADGGHCAGNGKPFSKSTLHDMLINRKYVGDFVFGRTSPKDSEGHRNNHKTSDTVTIISNNHEAIIDKAVFEEAQRKMKKNGSGTAKTHTNRYPLNGKIICKECGSLFTGNKKYVGKNKTPYTCYACPKHLKGKGKQKCTCKSVNAALLESIVLHSIFDPMLSHPEALAKAINSGNQIVVDMTQNEEYAEKLREYESKYDNIMEFIADNPEVDNVRFKKKLLEYSNKIDEYSEKLEGSKCQPVPVTAEDIKEITPEFYDIISSDKDAVIDIVQNCVENIYINNDDIEVNLMY